MPPLRSRASSSSSALATAGRRSRLGALRLRSRLGLWLLFCLACMILLAALALWSLGLAHVRASETAKDRLPRLDAVMSVERDSYEAMLNFAAYALSGDEAEYSGGRQSLARIKDALGRLRQLTQHSSPDVLGGNLRYNVELLYTDLAHFDDLAEETRVLVQGRSQSWAAFNGFLAEADKAFVLLLEEIGKAALPGAAARNAQRMAEDEQKIRELLALQGDFHALRAALSTALASDNDMTLYSLGTDFGRHATRLLAVWNVYFPESEAAGEGAGAVNAEEGEDRLDLVRILGGGRMALASLTADVERARELAVQRRDAAASIAGLARDLSREGVGALQRVTEANASSLLIFCIALAALVALALAGFFAIYKAFGRSVLEPVKAISDFAHDAAGGANMSTLAFSRADELGELAHSVRVLAGTCREALSRVQHRDRELEQYKHRASGKTLGEETAAARGFVLSPQAQQEQRAQPEKNEAMAGQLEDLHEDLGVAYSIPEPLGVTAAAVFSEASDNSLMEPLPAVPSVLPAGAVTAQRIAQAALSGSVQASREAGVQVAVDAAENGHTPSSAGTQGLAEPVHAAASVASNPLHDLAELSAGMRTLTRKLSDK